MTVYLLVNHQPLDIRTSCDCPPIPIRDFDYSAYDDRTYGGEPTDPIGYGRTEVAAVLDLLERLDEKYEGETLWAV